MLTSLYAKILIPLTLVAAISFCAWRIVKILNRPAPQIIRMKFDVVSVPSGNVIFAKSGVFRRPKEIKLLGIIVPVEGDPLFEQSRANLECVAGDEIEVEAEKEAFRRLDTTGNVYGWAGGSLQNAQLLEGFAKIDPMYDAPKPWREAEKSAKKSKKGMWAK